MKIKSIIFSLGMLLFVGNSLYAQQLDESRVRILPTTNSDILKVHYAIKACEPLKVKFITKEGGVVGFDKIKGGTFPNGLSKRYNVSNINDQEFWIEISSSLGTLTYRIEPSKDKQTFTSSLEKISYSPFLVAANK